MNGGALGGRRGSASPAARPALAAAPCTLPVPPPAVCSMCQIGRERFPEQLAAAEALAALTARVLVFNPRDSAGLMQTLQVRAVGASDWGWAWAPAPARRRSARAGRGPHAAAPCLPRPCGVGPYRPWRSTSSTTGCA